MSKQLTEVQRIVLESLIKLYEEKKRMIKSREVAEYLNKDEGTIRNIIMWLKNLGLVESRTGPAGGYVPTLKAYELIRTYPSMTRFDLGYGQLIVVTGSDEIRYPMVSLEIMGLLSSDTVKALARVVGDLSKVRPESQARIESMPWRKLVIEGIINSVNPSANEVLIEVSKMAIIPDELVGRIASKKLITVRDDETVREAARKLYVNGIRGAPVVDGKGNISGFITTTDIAMIVGNGGNLDDPVSKYMRKTVFTINENEPIVEAMRLMDFYGVGRLLVVNNAGKPVGIVTRTDILRFILALK